MPARKRAFEDMEPPTTPAVDPLLKRLRNMWEFSNLMQYIFIFGDIVKIDRDFDIEDLESECLRPEPSHKLAEIGLCLLKNVSSNRGLTPENFDEYTRRQYQAKKASQNPFGDDEQPKSFNDLEIEQKIRVLVDLSQWTLINANNIKEKMDIAEKDQASDWRIEPIGWDRDDRTYFVLDDNRLYRRTDPEIEATPTPEPQPKLKVNKNKNKGKKAKTIPRARPPPTRGTRTSKRLKLDPEEEVKDEDEEMPDQDEEEESKIDDDIELESSQQKGDLPADIKWECVAVTLEEYTAFLASIQKSRDPNEKALFKTITIDVMPIIEAAEEKRRQKALRRQRELEAIQKLATAKRSSRIAGRKQQEEEEAEARAAEEKRQRDLREAQAMVLRDQQMEQDRESRRLTREQRIKERELRRVLEEEALNSLTAAEAQSENDDLDGRKSKRQLKAEIAKKRRAVEELQQEEDWVFDCGGCGVHGANIDDGSHSVACDKCNVWQHSACLGISEADAEKEDFHLVCKDCIRKEEEASRPKPPKIKLKLQGSSSSPPSTKKAKKSHPNGTTTNGDIWHNTFGYTQSPSYTVSPDRFIAFKPQNYYIDSTLSGSPATVPTSSPSKKARVPSQPNVGGFIDYSPKTATSATNKPNGHIRGTTKFKLDLGPPLPKPMNTVSPAPPLSQSVAPAKPVSSTFTNGQPAAPFATNNISRPHPAFPTQNFQKQTDLGLQNGLNGTLPTQRPTFQHASAENVMGHGDAQTEKAQNDRAINIPRQNPSVVNGTSWTANNLQPSTLPGSEAVNGDTAIATNKAPAVRSEMQEI